MHGHLHIVSQFIFDFKNERPRRIFQNHFIVIMGHSGHSFNINFFGRILQITNSQYMEEYEIMPREIPKGKKKILKNNNKIQLLLRKSPWDQ